MTIYDLINITTDLPGNISRRRDDIYISWSNMDKFAENLVHIEEPLSILLTPYLLDDQRKVCELNYYEFDLEVRGEKSYFVEYNIKNCLPLEITENIKPQAIVAMNDMDFYRKAIVWYLEKMKLMKFKEEREYYTELQDSEVFYQIF